MLKNNKRECGDGCISIDDVFKRCNGCVCRAHLFGYSYFCEEAGQPCFNVIKCPENVTLE